MFLFKVKLSDNNSAFVVVVVFFFCFFFVCLFVCFFFFTETSASCKKKSTKATEISSCQNSDMPERKPKFTHICVLLNRITSFGNKVQLQSSPTIAKLVIAK